MSKLICCSAIDGAIEWVAKAESMLDEAIAAKGIDCPVALPDTAYYLPVIYSFTGEKVETLSDMRRVLNLAKEYLPQRPSDDVWLPYLGSTLDAGAAALFACEIIEACKYIIGPNPVDGIYLGAAGCTDNLIRKCKGRCSSNLIDAQNSEKKQNLHWFHGFPFFIKNFTHQLSLG